MAWYPEASRADGAVLDSPYNHMSRQALGHVYHHAEPRRIHRIERPQWAVARQKRTTLAVNAWGNQK